MNELAGRNKKDSDEDLLLGSEKVLASLIQIEEAKAEESCEIGKGLPLSNLRSGRHFAKASKVSANWSRLCY